MSGTEVIVSLISGVIAIVEATVRVCSAAADASGLPPAFRDVAQRLPLVKETLETVQDNLSRGPSAYGVYRTMKPVVEGCSDKAARLEAIFAKVMPEAGTSRSARYALAVRTVGKGSRVETLMKGIIEDVQLLASSQLMRLASPAQLDRLESAASEVSTIPPSIPRGASATEDDGSCRDIHEEKEECLRSLGFARLGARHADIEPALGRTCDWLFATAEFQEWCGRARLADHRGVLWVKGKPGGGKSTLMKRALEHCRETFPHDLVVAFFFNARGDVLEKSPLGMLRSVVYQLVGADDALYEELAPLFRENKRLHLEAVAGGGGDAAWRWEWPASQLRDFLVAAVRRRQRRPLILLIDALDECSEDEVRMVARLLETLSRDAFAAGSTLRVCLSSRHYPRVTIGQCCELVVDGAEGHDRDIAAYIGENLRAGDAALEAEVRRKAGGIFLWVVLVVELLNRADDEGRVEAMWRELESVPDDIERIFEGLLGPVDGADGRPGRSGRAETVLALQWVLLSERPLLLGELFFGIMVGTAADEECWMQRGRGGITAETMRRRITTASRGLVEVRKQGDRGGQGGQSDRDADGEECHRAEVQFIHLSVHDFLVRNGRLGRLDAALAHDPIGASHGQLWACCWRYLGRCINQQQEWRPGQQPEPPDAASRLREHPFLYYAIRYILAHADKALACAGASAAASVTGAVNGTWARGSVQRDVAAWLEQQEGWFDCWKELVWATGFEGLRRGAEGGLLFAVSAMGYGNILALMLSEQRLRETLDINAQAQSGWYGTALIAASCMQQPDVIHQLLGAGAQADTQTLVGYYGTALIAASSSGNTKVVQQLLNAGAKATTPALAGGFATALMAARRYPNVVKMLKEAAAEAKE